VLTENKRRSKEIKGVTDLPDFVMTISVPSPWNRSQRSLDSSDTLGSSSMPSSSGSNGLMAAVPPAKEWAASMSSALMRGELEGEVNGGGSPAPGILPNRPCMVPKAAKAER